MEMKLNRKPLGRNPLSDVPYRNPGKLRGLVDATSRRRVNILCVQETKWKGQRVKEVENTSLLWYSGSVVDKNGLGILIDKSLKDKVVDVKRQGDMIILVKLVWGCSLEHYKCICPQVGLRESEKKQYPTNEKLFIGGDLNGHVGSTNVGYELARGGFGDKQAKFARTKWWKLKEDISKVFKERVFVEGTWSEEEDAKNMWVKMATCIKKVASEVFGVTKGSKGEPKDTWRWTEDVQKAIKEKKECYRSLFHDRSTINIETYKVAKKTAKRVEGKNDVYKMVRIRERNTRYLNQVKCIKDEMDQLLVKGQDIKQRWQRIQELEVKEALKRMKGGKAMGPDGIPIEVWRCLGDTAIVWLTKLFNHIFQSNKMLDEWSTLVPIFKYKGDIKVVPTIKGLSS
ncbi:hypothetical protein Zm00014a_015628 [Zea mays]|uniref:Endonuclease/exonuclease/phosphatase domain-containing protein n=1 Tax=Zea mays TaxID=4577 RepID=A0A3L6FLA7_MAIZE|nr:hypothetical protein Zm00014a_015628 [Zea mays]